MRCVKQEEIFQRLHPGGGLVFARYTEGLIELHAASHAARAVYPLVTLWEREIRFRRHSRKNVGGHRFAKAIGRRAARDHQVPGLGIAPGRSALRELEDFLHYVGLDFARKEFARAIAGAENLFEFHCWFLQKLSSRAATSSVSRCAGWAMAITRFARSRKVQPRSSADPHSVTTISASARRVVTTPPASFGTMRDSVSCFAVDGS